MWIDFHVHGILTKKAQFELEHFMNEIYIGKESGLDGFVLSEHFNTKDYFLMYRVLEDNFPYVDDYYDIDGFKVFMGLEVDVDKGGHVILASHRENIFQIRKRLDKHTQVGKFIALKDLLNLAEDFSCLTIGAHPFRGQDHLGHTQDLDQLKSLDGVELNATDIFNKGLDETKRQVLDLAESLGNVVVTGSDSHYPIQIGSVKTKLARPCSTIKDIKNSIKEDRIKVQISKALNTKVFAARTTKSYLKSKISL